MPSTRNSRGRSKIDISVSDINSNSTCSKLNLPFDLACYHCKEKLDPLINRRVNKKQKTERQKSQRNKCQQLWDNYWVNLNNVTNGQLMKHRVQRSYLGILPDVDISYYCIYEENNKAESPLPPYFTTDISLPPSLPRTSSENIDKSNENEGSPYPV